MSYSYINTKCTFQFTETYRRGSRVLCRTHWNFLPFNGNLREGTIIFLKFNLIAIWFSAHLWWLIASKEFYFQVTKFINKICSCALPRPGVTTQCRYLHNKILLILIIVWMDMLIMQKLNKILTRQSRTVGGQRYQQGICLYNTNISLQTGGACSCNH